MVREEKKIAYLNLIKIFSREIASEHMELRADVLALVLSPLPAPFQAIFLLQSGTFPSKHAPVQGAQGPLS